MFRGVQHINLDAKGRMAVPSRQRELLSVLGDGHIVLTVDTQTLVSRFTPARVGAHRARCAGIAGTQSRSETIPEIGTGLRQ